MTSRQVRHEHVAIALRSTPLWGVHSKWLVLCGAIVACAAADLRAAPPAVTHLFPAGGQPGTTVEAAVGGTPGARPVRVWSDRADVHAVLHEKEDKLVVTLEKDAVPGPVRFRLANAEGASALVPFVVQNLPAVREVEPNDVPSAAQAVPDGSVVVDGLLEKAGDVDVFAVRVPAGRTLVAAVTANETLGAPLDAIVQIVSPEGFVLVQNHDAHGLDPLAAWTPQAETRLLVRVFAWPEKPSSSIRLAGGANFVYRLALATGPVVRSVQPSALRRDAPGSLDAVGWNLPADRTAYPVASPTSLPRAGTNDDERLLPAAFPWPVLFPTTVALVDSPVLVDVRGTGRARNAEPPLLPVPAVVSGTLAEDGSASVFRCVLEKGRPVLFRVEARSLGFVTDAVLKVVPPDGTAATEKDDAGRGTADPELPFAPKVSGEHRIEVRELTGVGGPDRAYRLSVLEPRPDFALTVPGDLFSAAAGSDLKIPVTIVREAGFKGTVAVRVEGLPESVEAHVEEPQPAAAATGAKKPAAPGPVQIRLRGTVPLGTPFRLVGFDPDDPGRPPKFARTVSPPTSTAPSTTDLWLTVLPAQDEKK